MIPLRKFTAAHDLYGPAILWLQERDAEYRDAINKGLEISENRRRAYSNTRVKDALNAETADKCAYCESYYKSVSFGDVEHVLPHSNDPFRLLDYTNLTIGCQYCNNKKGAYEDAALPLLDPFNEDPTQRLTALGPMIVPIPGTDGDGRAEHTIALLELMRAHLLEERSRIVIKMCDLAKSYKESASEPVRDLALRTMREMTSRKGQFALVARAAFVTLLPDVELLPLY